MELRAARPLTDAVAIVVFAALGQLSHNGGVSAAGFARDALPLLAGWFGAAVVFGPYTRSGRRPFVLTWLVGVTAGVLLRAAVLGRTLGGRELAFLLTSLAFVLVFVLAARLLVAAVARGRAASAS